MKPIKLDTPTVLPLCNQSQVSGMKHSLSSS